MILEFQESSGSNSVGTVGTPGFIAPEILNEQPYGVSADVSLLDQHIFTPC